MTTTLELPFPPRSLSSNGSHGHWRRHAAAVKAYRDECSLHARAQSDMKPRPQWQRRRVSLTFCTKGVRATGLYAPRDITNAISAVKPLFDALTDRGFISDDSKAWMELGACDWDATRGPFIMVTIEDIA